MTCGMRLAGMAPSRSLSPGGAMADSQLGAGREPPPSGSRTERLSSSLAPTAGPLCCRLRIAGAGELDALCVNVSEGGGDVHCEVKARKTEWIRAWLLIGH